MYFRQRRQTLQRRPDDLEDDYGSVNMTMMARGPGWQKRVKTRGGLTEFSPSPLRVR